MGGGREGEGGDRGRAGKWAGLEGELEGEGGGVGSVGKGAGV